MTHYASRAFWALHGNLPNDIRALADKNFELLKADPRHPSLHFKRIGQLWFWIGSHADYDKTIG